MQSFAMLRLMYGSCNSFGLSENAFRYPLQTDWEKGLYKRALEKITLYPLQLSYSWWLIDGKSYKEFLARCSQIQGAQPEPITRPDDIMHGWINFGVYMRIDGYTAVQKDELVGKFVDLGIMPSEKALDFTFHYYLRKAERFGAPIDNERLVSEQRAAFARYLTFRSE